MDIVVKGRNVEVPEHFREHVAGKLAPSERLDSRVIRIDVELMHEKNPRQSDRCQRVEITCYSKGPVIRAEAANGDFYAALDAAVLKLEARLRKAHDRRRQRVAQRGLPPARLRLRRAAPGRRRSARRGHGRGPGRERLRCAGVPPPTARPSRRGTMWHHPLLEARSDPCPRRGCTRSR